MRRRLFTSPVSPIGRIGVRPVRIEPAAAMPPRPRGSRRPHTDGKVAAVRRLIEDTVLTYGEIAARTGVGRASICRWTRDGQWKRPLFAPRATDTVPTARASHHLKARTLAARLLALAERTIRELEAAPGTDLDRLAEALELLKMARLAARPRRGRRRKASTPLVPATAGTKGTAATDAASDIAWAQTFEAPALTVIRGLRAAGVDTMRAPEAALEDFMDSRAPPPKRPSRGGWARRKGRFTRNEYHQWMLRKIGD